MNTATLLEIPLFLSMEVQELEEIFDRLKITETNFKKGEILAMQDEPVNRLIILLTGSVKGEMTDPSGKVVKVEDIEAPSPLAILFLFGRHNRFPVQATAASDGTAIIIPRQSVLEMLSISRTLLKNYLDISADFATRLSSKLHLMSFRSIRQKMAVYLLELAKQQGSDTLTLDKSKTALAEYFGVSRPSLEREITNMDRDGLISARRSEITLVDRPGLIRLIN